MAAKIRLGEWLVSEGLLGELQLEAALAEQARYGHRLGETLVELGFLAEVDLVRALTRSFGIPGVDLEGKAIEPDVLALVPAPLAEKFRCLPLFRRREDGEDVLYLGIDDPTHPGAQRAVSAHTGMVVSPVVVGPVQLRQALAEYYDDEGPDDLPPTAPLVDDYEARPSRPRAERAPAPAPTERTAPPVAKPPAAPPAAARPLPAAPGGPAARATAPRPAAPAPPAASAARMAAAPAPAAAPPVARAPVAAPAARPAAAADAPAREVLGHAALQDAPRPRDVPTRIILQGLVRLLVEAGVVERADLLRAVEAVRRESSGESDEDA